MLQVKSITQRMMKVSHPKNKTTTITLDGVRSLFLFFWEFDCCGIGKELSHIALIEIGELINR